MARLCGQMPSSMPVRNTWSNSKPLVLCKVIRVTPGLPSNWSASLTSAAASRKSVKVSPASMPSATARASSSRFSSRATSSGALRSLNMAIYPDSSRTACKNPGGSWVARASCNLRMSSWNARKGVTARPADAPETNFSIAVHSGVPSTRADSRSNIQYAEQRNVILRMHCQANIGKRVLHFGAIVETEPTHKFVAQAAPAENLFESARLEISAIFDRARLVRIVVENALELAGDKFRFGLRIPRLEILQIRSWAFLRAQRFAQPLRIVRDDRAGGVENILRRTVVAFQFDDSGGGKIPGKTQEDGNVCAAPAVDRLILVTHNTQVLLGPGQQPHQVILDAVRVLIFVHVNILKACLPFLTRGRGFAQQAR